EGGEVTTTAERDALLDAVFAHPDDDTPRLIYADWLDEHGEGVHAEFIRRQVELVRVNGGPPGQAGVKKRGGTDRGREVRWDGGRVGERLVRGDGLLQGVLRAGVPQREGRRAVHHPDRVSDPLGPLVAVASGPLGADARAGPVPG